MDSESEDIIAEEGDEVPRGVKFKERTRWSVHLGSLKLGTIDYFPGTLSGSYVTSCPVATAAPQVEVQGKKYHSSSQTIFGAVKWFRAQVPEEGRWLLRISDAEETQDEGLLDITHEVTWDEREGFAGILVTTKVNGDICGTRHVASLGCAYPKGHPDYSRFLHRKQDLKDLFDRKITWEEYRTAIA